MIKTLRGKILDSRRIKFKGYTISDIPKGFDKDQALWFNRNGLTWIEKIDNPFWENF